MFQGRIGDMAVTIWAKGAVLAALLCGPASAENIALVIGNRDYRDMARVVDADRVVGAADALRDQGIAVLAGEGAVLEDMRALVVQFEQMAPNADGLLVVLAGRFVQGGNDTFFLPVDTDLQGLTGLPGQSLPLSSVLQILSLSPGEAFLVLAEDGTVTEQGPFLRQGIGDLNIPQGVTVVRGAPGPVAGLLRDVLAVQGAALAEGGDLALSGYLPVGHGFLSSDAGGDTVALAAAQADAARERLRADGAEQRTRLAEQVSRQAQQAATLAEDQLARADAALWAAAQEMDTVSGYSRYVQAFPAGANAAEAGRLIGDMQGDPFRAARLAEEALALNRDQRRAVQRNLTALGFNTRGVDGIFGNGTRTAIRDWQARGGRQASGFVDAAQIRTLEQQAAEAEAARRAEEEARAAEALRVDNAYWRQLGSGRNEDALRAYLARYAQGQWSGVARERLAAIEQARRAEDEARREEERRRAEEERRRDDQAYWRRLGEGQSEDALRAYLDRFPRGAFSQVARERLARIEDARRTEDEARRAEEQRRADDAFWAQTGAGGTEQGLRAYLAQFPDGRWADSARTLLASLAPPPGPRVDPIEELAWQRALGANRVDAYERYLEAYPRGTFVDEARQRIEALDGGDRGDDRAAGEAAEEALGLNRPLRQAVEDRLAGLGFNPGQVDGQFDQATRRALSQYQQSTGLPATGYVSQDLVVQLLTDSVRNLLGR